MCQHGKRKDGCGFFFFMGYLHFSESCVHTGAMQIGIGVENIDHHHCVCESVYVSVRRRGAGGRGTRQVEGGPALMKWRDSCICRGKGQVTVALGRGMSVRQNETHSGCGYENDRHGWGGFRGEGHVYVR